MGVDQTTTEPSAGDGVPVDGLTARTEEILQWRSTNPRRRKALTQRALITADVAGLTLAFVLAEMIWGRNVRPPDQVSLVTEMLIFVLTIPIWVLVAKLHGLYDNDHARTNHSTADEMPSLFHLTTAGVWVLVVATWLSGVSRFNLPKLIGFWALALVLVTATRLVARATCRGRTAFQQNTLIVGAGHVGQLLARKIANHPEYGLNVVGFVDRPRTELRPDIGNLPVIPPTERLSAAVSQLQIDRILVAFPEDPDAQTLDVLRSLEGAPVQIDLVPRMFEMVGPSVDVHTIEGVPLVGVPPVGIRRTPRYVKRVMDIAGAAVGLVVLSPLMGFIALRIRLDRDGPALFRQTRLGLAQTDFTVYKFRTMAVGDNDEAHRAHVLSVMDSTAVADKDGIFKLQREDIVTPIGRWLRKYSLDELPQLFNVLKGDMSLVGPRPSLPYEVPAYSPHHLERFRVKPGLTGLWQVTARAHATHVEALDMDVAYVRGWSLGLDLWLICRTPLALFRQRGATA